MGKWQQVIERGAFSWLTVAIFACAGLSVDAAAQDPSEMAPESASSEPEAAVSLTSPKELEAFIDGLMAAHMQTRKIPAATISVVKDGELFFAKGYGYADRERRIPVDPARTLFRPGSISKLFTWTAVI